MAIRPPKCLRVEVTSINPVAFWTTDDATGDPWVGMPYQWEVEMTVEAQSHSSHATTTPFTFNGFDITVDNWLIFGNEKFGLKIVSVDNTTQSDAYVKCVVEDVDRFNLFVDPVQTGSGIGGASSPGNFDCFVAELSDDGLPVFHNISDLVSPYVTQQIESRFRLRNQITTYVPVIQPGHGFAVNDPLILTPTGYEKATAATDAVQRIVGFVSSIGIPGPENFTYRPIGRLVDVDLSTVGTDGAFIYLDSVGALTASKPANAKPLYIKLSATKGIQVSGAGGGGAGIGSVVEDIAPKLGGDLGVNGYEIYSEDAENIILNPRGTGYVEIDGTGPGAIQAFYGSELKLKGGDGTDVENAGDLVLEGGNGFTPETGSSTNSGNVVIRAGTGGVGPGKVIINGFTFPSADGSENQVLSTDGLGNLFWRDAAASGGGSQFIDTPTDGSLTDGRAGKDPAVKTWIAGTTKISDAVDDLNEILGLLLPPSPPALSTKMLVISSAVNTRGGSNILLASGVTDNATTGTAAGTQVLRVGTASVSTDAVTSFGSGNSGTLTAMVNGTAVGQITLDSSDNTGTNGSLQITRNGAYPSSTPGFWEDLDANINGTLLVGVNSLKMQHSETGTTNSLVVVYDDLGTAPTLSGTAVVQTTPGTMVYSSGVPHYNANAVLTISGSVSGLVGQTYLGSSVLQITSSPAVSAQVDVNPGAGGLPAQFSKNMAAQSFTQTVTLSGTVHATSQISVKARNAAADSAASAIATKINVMSGSPSSAVIEMSIPVDATMGVIPSGAQTNAGRVTMATGDTPADDKASLTVPDWVSTVTAADHEAMVVGGVLKHDVTNYSTGYLPVGIDRSSGAANQYVTFMFRRSAVSQFKIQVTGTYTGCWVKMPGIAVGTAPNGWWDMYQLYNGNGVPGQNGSSGCALGSVMNGNAGTYTATFGTETSTNATNNIILVRFKLTSGQSITALSFKKV